MLTANARNVLDGMSNDYIPVAIADTSEEAMKAADMLEKTIADRKAK
jgi:RecA/RadA recombinase